MPVSFSYLPSCTAVILPHVLCVSSPCSIRPCWSSTRSTAYSQSKMTNQTFSGPTTPYRMMSLNKAVKRFLPRPAQPLLPFVLRQSAATWRGIVELTLQGHEFRHLVFFLLSVGKQGSSWIIGDYLLNGFYCFIAFVFVGTRGGVSRKGETHCSLCVKVCLCV